MKSKVPSVVIEQPAPDDFICEFAGKVVRALGIKDQSKSERALARLADRHIAIISPPGGGRRYSIVHTNVPAVRLQGGGTSSPMRDTVDPVTKIFAVLLQAVSPEERAAHIEQVKVIYDQVVARLVSEGKWPLKKAAPGRDSILPPKRRASNR